MARDEHGKTLTAKFAGTANPAGNADLQGFPFSEGWDENYWPPGTSTISGPVVNAVLRIISAVGKEINEYGILEWDAGLTYQQHAIVLGSDGALYQSQQASNVGIDPTGDTDDSHWALITARYLASQTEAATGTDTEKLMTPARVRNAISGLIADVSEAQTENNNVNLMTPQRVRNLITHILATAAEARDGIENDVLMTPARVQDAIQANPPSVSRHDSPVITLDAATGSVVDTTATLGTNAVAREFQPLLVAARARGGYSIGDEVVPLDGSVPASVRKVNDRSFAVHCTSGVVSVPDFSASGIYFFESTGETDVYRVRQPSDWDNAADVGRNTTHSITAATYWDNGSDQRILVLGHNQVLYQITNPLRPDLMTEVGGTGNGRLAFTTSSVFSLAAHRVGGELRLYVIAAVHPNTRLVRINPNNPSDTSSPYGPISGNFVFPAGTVRGFLGMTSHQGNLYTIRRIDAIDRLIQVNIINPANSTILGSGDTGDPINALFSVDNRLFGISTPGVLPARSVWEFTSHTQTSVVLVSRGQLPAGMENTGGAAVIPAPIMRLGNSGDSTADFNLKIRYSA